LGPKKFKQKIGGVTPFNTIIKKKKKKKKTPFNTRDLGQMSHLINSSCSGRAAAYGKNLNLLVMQ
jgi:hypothetical protein